jgi:branched-chain amino acid transport system permease protein
MFEYLENLTILICISSIGALSLNMLMGYAGIFSLAHAAILGLGAYTAAILAMGWSPNFWLSAIAAMVVGAVASLLISVPALRVRGDYFVVISLGMQIIAVTSFIEFKGVTGGLAGISSVPSPTIFGYAIDTLTGMLVLSAGSLAAVVAFTAWLLRSSFGRNLTVVRDNEVAALAFGKNVTVIKAIVVACSCSLCAYAGVLYVFHLSFVNPESFTTELSVSLMAMIILGGAGTVIGPIIGAVVLQSLPALLTYLTLLPPEHLGSIQQIIFGLAMVLLMLFRPAGIAGRTTSSSTR